MDVFDYSDHFFYQVARSHDISHPIQIELHPGIHCDLYRCLHCYGHGQPPLPGDVLSPEEIGAALDDVSACAPTVIVSGVTTEPLTHPQSAAVLREVKRRGLPLGLYTKGRRLEGDVVDALLEGSGECWVTVSLDDIGKDEYMRRHGISSSSREGNSGFSGSEYYERVMSNIEAFTEMRNARSAAVEIRVALLIFADSSDETKVVETVKTLADMADCVRIAFPQNRNDGMAPGELPGNRAEILQSLSQRFALNPKVKILQNTADPQRKGTFHRCWAQHFQACIDKSGNVFPCPQVAVGTYRHLAYGNIRQQPLRELLVVARRRQMFDMDVDTQMRCRICDRKDEAVNVALNDLTTAYG
jgi:radical SAM protein with 4Fe4S-binding SPASM domain